MAPEQAGPSRPRVLIVSASVGAGHSQAARAIADSLRTDIPQAPVEVVDVLAFAPWAFRAYYAGGYSLAVSKFPRVYGAGYWLNDRPQRAGRGPAEHFRLWHERQHLRRFARYVSQAPPDLVLHTHFLAAPLLGRMRRLGQLQVPQMVVVTDIRVHRFWHSEQVARWFVPADESAETLRRWGIGPDRITVSGIPIHPKWTAPLHRERVLAEWSLPADRPIVLLGGGVDFTCGPIVKTARRIVADCDDVFLAVLAGRNKKLLAQLSRLPEAGQRLVGISFTDRVQELVEVCSLMVTKAGGLSTAECLAKATPMVLLPPVPGQEAGNAAHFARQGAAVVARDARDVADQVSRLLRDPDELDRMAENARRLYRPATKTIAAAIREAVGHEGTTIQQGCRGSGES